MSDRLGISQALYCQAADVVATWPAFALIAAGEQTALITTASEKIDEVCRRPFGFAAQLVTETFDGSGRASLWLSTRPVISVQSITINTEAIDNTSGESWTANANTGLLVRGTGFHDRRFGLRFPHGTQNVVVQYYAGYDAFPARLVRAAAWTVKWLHERGKVAGIYSAESIGDWSGTLNAAASSPLPAHVLDMLTGFVQDDVFA